MIGDTSEFNYTLSILVSVEIIYMHDEVPQVSTISYLREKQWSLVSQIHNHRK